MRVQSLTHNHKLLRRMGFGAFWVAVFILNAGPHWAKYSSNRELIETAGMVTGLQFMVALIASSLLVPKFLEREQWLRFLLYLLGVVIIAAEINVFIRYTYLEQLYPASYKGFLDLFADMSLLERLDLRWNLRYILSSKGPILMAPAVVLIAYDFYTKQQTLLSINEQKKTAELDALKNQLNPHFIFNTLNNIYALALKKSDEAPVAIEKLSAILDYVVYRCNANYVDLADEIALIENYVSLEKLRYGKRLLVSITNSVEQTTQIAPLILLTLLENACKHSTREELKQSIVSISLEETRSQLKITISNSKPSARSQTTEDEPKVGLINLRKQLKLLYPNNHRFEISDMPDRYTCTLSLPFINEAPE